jgi:hypothetical protein
MEEEDMPLVANTSSRKQKQQQSSKHGHSSKAAPFSFKMSKSRSNMFKLQPGVINRSQRFLNTEGDAGQLSSNILDNHFQLEAELVKINCEAYIPALAEAGFLNDEVRYQVYVCFVLFLID